MSRVLGNLLRRQVSSGTRIIAASSWISDTLPFGRLLVRRAERNQQCSQLRKVFQPVASRRDSRLR